MKKRNSNELVMKIKQCLTGLCQAENVDVIDGIATTLYCSNCRHKPAGIWVDYSGS
jgi:hypothetical protein